MRIFLLMFCLWAGGALAQTFPLYEQTTVNDFADLLPATEESALAARLQALRDETGVEMTVLTLDSQRPFAPDQSLEAFSRALFDHWGIGDAVRNDGVLVMVLRADRAMRIELGAGYGQAWNTEARHIVDTDFLPRFRNDDYEGCITAGVEAVIAEIVMPFNAGDPRPERQADQNRGVGIFSGIFAGFVAMVIGFFVFVRRMIKRFRKCPNCGQGGLNKSRIVDVQASHTSTGSGRHHLYCDHCDYDDFVSFTIAQRSRSSSGSGGFSGGSSGGGGASGR